MILLKELLLIKLELSRNLLLRSTRDGQTLTKLLSSDKRNWNMLFSDWDNSNMLSMSFLYGSRELTRLWRLLSLCMEILRSLRSNWPSSRSLSMTSKLISPVWIPSMMLVDKSLKLNKDQEKPLRPNRSSMNSTPSGMLFLVRVRIDRE